MTSLRDWLAQQWLAGALWMAAALLLLTPVLWHGLPLALMLIFLASPVYMLHQIEEHRGDRFKRFVNQRLFGGVEALTTDAVLVINLPGVWGINLAAFYVAGLVAPGYGLAAPYLILVNALSHIGAAAKMRSYNPGLVTSLVLFLPLSVVTICMVQANIWQQLLGLVVALGIHAAIILHIKRRAGRFSLTESGTPRQHPPQRVVAEHKMMDQRE